MTLDHLAQTQDPTPVDQLRAEVDTELEQQDAQAADLKAELLRLRRELAEAKGAAAEPVAAPTEDTLEQLHEQEMLAEGCIKVPLVIDDPDRPGGLMQTFVWVRPHNEWRQDSIAAVGMGNFPMWAQECLASQDDIDEWMNANPSLTQIRGFFMEWRRLTGQDEGKSSASPRRSRRTPLR